MKSRSCTSAVLFFPVVSAVVDGEPYSGEVIRHIIRRHPVLRLVGVVIVAVHHQAVGAEKRILRSSPALIFCRNIVVLHRLLQALLIRNGDLLCIDVVFCLSPVRGGIQRKDKSSPPKKRRRVFRLLNF